RRPAGEDPRRTREGGARRAPGPAAPAADPRRPGPLAGVRTLGVDRQPAAGQRRHRSGPAGPLQGRAQRRHRPELDPPGDGAAGPALQDRDPAGPGGHGDRRQRGPELPLRRAGPALDRGRGAQGPAAAVRRVRAGVRAHPDPQLRGLRPLGRRPGAPPFIFESAFTAKLLTLLALDWTEPTPEVTMTRLPRVLLPAFLLLALLVPLAAAAQERGLEIDIIGGNASALPIAVVPMPYQGSGAAPDTDVASVVAS